MEITTLHYEHEFCSNTHLIIKDNEVIAFDLGQMDDSFLKYLARHQYKLKAIFLTHGHFDHMRLINRVDKNVPVYIHVDDKDLIFDPFKNCSRLCGEDISYEREVITLDDQEIIEIDDIKIQLIHTPFHTKGSSIYLINNKALITGDTLFKGVIGRYDLPTSCPRFIESSLKKIYDIYKKHGDMNVYVGHGINTTLQKEISFNPYLKNIS